MSTVYDISIVTIVFNGEKYIEQTIKSVLDQPNVNVEYIVIDGGSSDTTISIIDRYIDRIAFFVSEPDRGIFDAINKGLTHVTSPITGIFHCGDFLMPGVLKKIINNFYENNADVLYGDIRYLYTTAEGELWREQVADHHFLRNSMSIYHPSTFVKSAIYAENGFYDARYKSAADYNYFLKLFLDGCTFIHIPCVIATFRAGGTSGNFQVSLKENYLIRRDLLGIIPALSYSALRIIMHSYQLSRSWFLRIFMPKSLLLWIKMTFYGFKINR